MSLHSDSREDGESNSDSSEAKTDRYGFLLVNGDTNNDSDEPCPELVRHREMKWINLMSQWDQVHEKRHKIKSQCQKGIPASVRSKCWPLLCGANQRKENNKDLYKTLESSPGLQSWIDVIKRDTDRQFPFHEMFQSKDSHGQQGLLKVLKAYTQFRPDEGYCQAQGPVAAVLLMNMPIEEAFWCLVQISELYLPGYYSPLLEGVLFDAAVLFGVLKRTCPAAYKHMQRQGVEPLMFATDWLMCLYSRHLPFNTLLRVWDLFFCNGVRVLFQVAVVLVRRCLGEARHRKECEGQMETLERLRSVRGRVQHVQADTFIQEVCSVPLSLAELQRQTEKELEKWRKERPGSTFDPRDRCHGYYTIWEKGKEKEKENEKQSVGLTASLMRSHSSLSPAVLRKKWRKRGSKAETEDWDGRGFSKQDSDDEEKRRASVCGVAGELQAKTHKTSQGYSLHLNKERNTTMNPKRVEPQPNSGSSKHSVTVFEEDENEADAAAALSHTETIEREETRLPSSRKDDSQIGNSQQKTENQLGTETCRDEETKVQTPRQDQGEDILTHQDQSQGEAPPQQQQQQQQSPHQEEDKDTRTKLEEATQENRNKQEEEMEIHTCNSETNISTHEAAVTITQQEVNVTQEQEIQICSSEQETKSGMNSKHEEEIQIDSSKQEEEIGTNILEQKEGIHLTSTEQEVEIQEEQELETKVSEQEVELQEEKELETKVTEQEVEQQEEKEFETKVHEQEVEIQVEKNSETKVSEQEVEIQVEKDSETKVSEQEVEIQVEKEFETKVREQEVEIQVEKEFETKVSEQEVELQEEKEFETKLHEHEVEIQVEKDSETKVSEQEVETQEEKEIKTKTNEQEVEVLEERELDTKGTENVVEVKVNSSKQEVGVHEEKELQADNSDQEVETTDEDKVTNRDNKEQKIKVCLIKHKDVSKDEQQQEQDSRQKNEVEQSLELEEETLSNVKIPESQGDVQLGAPSVHEEACVIDEFSESGSHTVVEKEKQEREGERQHSEHTKEVIQISDTPLAETKEADLEEEKSSAPPCVQLEITTEHSGKSETLQDSSQTQEENMEVNKISTSEHEEHDRTSRSSNLEPGQPEKKKEEVEIEINIALDSNLVKPSPGSNPLPQLRLRRSSTTHTSYPTILSEDTFREPQRCSKQDSCPQTTKAEDSDITEARQTQSSKPEDPQIQDLPTQSKSDKPKRRGLFHRLRADTPSKATIPKIVIQDFSEGDEKLSSKERRRRRRMQDRKEKEEEKERKKLEKAGKEKEKERERKKPQTRGKSFQVLNRKHFDVDDVFSETSGSPMIGRKRKSYSESFF